MSAGSSWDTIVAPATPVGRSALAIVRIDGPRSGEILEALSGEAAPDARRATFTRLRDGSDLLDECVVVRYAAPQSFTGNDLVELTLHGSPLLVGRVVEAAVGLGARIAEPGEFTERAVLNGKLDLVQAESIADLISARTALQARLSLGNLGGMLSRTAATIRESLLFVISRLEGALDFSEEGYEFITREEAVARLEGAIASCRSMARTFERGHATVEGISAVILGAPNSGKSTLLNRLVGSDRAIVTPIPGTTRDIVRETIEIGGLPVTLADTAGLREASDEVEEIGIGRARDAAGKAAIVLYLVDASIGMRERDLHELGSLGRDDVMVVYTKTDLAAAPEGAIAISVAAESGIQNLLGLLDERVRDSFAAPEGSPTIVNARQKDAVESTGSALEAALDSFEEGASELIVLVDLYRAATSLGLLTGAITRDEVFREIFARFCIGK